MPAESIAAFLAAAPCGGNELRQITVGLAAGREQNQSGTLGEPELGTDDEWEFELLRGDAMSIFCLSIVRPRAVVAFYIFLSFGLAHPLPAIADRDCTDAESALADKWLILNKRDTTAAIEKHLPWGTPKVAGPGVRVLVHRDYVVGYNDGLRVPIWTAYRLDARGLNTVPERVNCFRQDPRIPDKKASVPDDYDEDKFDQGHLAPSEDMSHNLRQNINSFILSNMAPQYGPFNRVIWKRLETQGRTWAKINRTVYIISGSIFDSDGDGKPDAESSAKRMKSRNGNKRVAIPSHFFKIVVRDCGNGKLESLAFILPNENKSHTGTAGLKFLDDHRRSIADIEATTGLSFFPEAADSKLTRTKTAAMWPLKPPPRGSTVTCGT